MRKTNHSAGTTRSIEQLREVSEKLREDAAALRLIMSAEKASVAQLRRNAQAARDASKAACGKAKAISSAAARRVRRDMTARRPS